MKDRKLGGVRRGVEREEGSRKGVTCPEIETENKEGGLPSVLRIWF